MIDDIKKILGEYLIPGENISGDDLNSVCILIDQLFEEENLKLRALLWAGHACSGKYCDDGELQCGYFLPIIDFKRDSPEEIERKVTIHYQQLRETRDEY